MLARSYDIWMVALSFLVAVLASFTALAMATRATTARSPAATWAWRLGGGCAMGLGIWSMHFIGMLAFSLPIAISYDLALTLASLAAAMAASIFALWLVSLATMPRFRLAAGAVPMASGIATMHYLGMAAMRMQPSIQWHAGWVLASLAVALAASWVALYMAFRLRQDAALLHDRLAAAGLLGLGIGGMHYTGMAAARFPDGSVCGAIGTYSLPANMLALLVLIGTVLILGLALGLAWMEQRVEAQLLRMRDTALHDPLTRLPNRRLLQRRIEGALAQVEQEGGRFAVVFLDLDRFKQVNDALGHQAGDDLLVAVSTRIVQLLRPGDVLARLGGDEFVLVVRIVGDDDMTLLARRLLRAVESTPLAQDHRLHISASLGIAVCPEHATTERQLMACADAAMYVAKQAGRNQYAMYAIGMAAPIGQQRHLLAGPQRPHAELAATR